MLQLGDTISPIKIREQYSTQDR